MTTRIRTLIYTDDAQKPPRANAAVTIGTAKRKVVRLPVYSEGVIRRIYVKQAGGTNAAFTVDLLNSKTPYGDGTEAEADYNAAVAINHELFQVIPRQSVTSGSALNWPDSATDEHHEHPFSNTDQVSNTAVEPYLYLVIIPDNSADPSTWEVAVTYEYEDH